MGSFVAVNQRGAGQGPSPIRASFCRLRVSSCLFSCSACDWQLICSSACTAVLSGITRASRQCYDMLCLSLCPSGSSPPRCQHWDVPDVISASRQPDQPITGVQGRIWPVAHIFDYHMQSCRSCTCLMGPVSSRRRSPRRRESVGGSTLRSSSVKLLSCRTYGDMPYLGQHSPGEYQSQCCNTCCSTCLAPA